jgi:large subunit ribosomal protein L15
VSSPLGLHLLKPKPGSRRPRKRVGRGEGSGLGKTAGRGHKGAGSRSGSKRKAGYEGGQNPIHMRMRKLRGPHMKKSMPFENFRTHTQPVNVADLEARFDAGAEVTPESLRAAGLATRKDPVKILARGDISKKLIVKAHGFSAAARQKIEAAGGTVEYIGGEPKPKPPKENRRKASKPETPKEPRAKAPTPDGGGSEAEQPSDDSSEQPPDDSGSGAEQPSDDSSEDTPG